MTKKFLITLLFLPLFLLQKNSAHATNCAAVPTLMYHHIAEKASSLSVTPKIFSKQLDYLSAKNYTPITMAMLNNFFDTATPLPKKPILLTFDDGYADFYTNAYPLLKSKNFPATVFLPTGLIEVKNYLTWSNISEMKDNQVLFANHTWSHYAVTKNKDKIIFEITTADKQLSEKNLNSPKVFAYPYGSASQTAVDSLKENGYSLAFTTLPGRKLCSTNRLTLPRIRVGNSSLSAYGL